MQTYLIRKGFIFTLTSSMRSGHPPFSSTSPLFLFSYLFYTNKGLPRVNIYFKSRRKQDAINSNHPCLLSMEISRSPSDGQSGSKMGKLSLDSLIWNQDLFYQSNTVFDYKDFILDESVDQSPWTRSEEAIAFLPHWTFESKFALVRSR